MQKSVDRSFRTFKFSGERIGVPAAFTGLIESILSQAKTIASLTPGNADDKFVEDLQARFRNAIAPQAGPVNINQRGLADEFMDRPIRPPRPPLPPLNGPVGGGP